MTTLKYGSRGEKGKEIQQQLKNLGYLNGAVDGIFGNQTKAAVKEFQTVAKLTANGKCDTNTHTDHGEYRLRFINFANNNR